MEYEVRFYYPKEDITDIMNKLSNIKGLEKCLRTYEKTIQYNHCDKLHGFYSHEIDGRFRVRISSNDNETKCKLSWKRRLNNTTENEVTFNKPMPSIKKIN